VRSGCIIVALHINQRKAHALLCTSKARKQAADSSVVTRSSLPKELDEEGHAQQDEAEADDHARAEAEVLAVAKTWLQSSGLGEQVPAGMHCFLQVRLLCALCACRVGQNRVYAPYMTVYLQYIW
jgi:hypothetical protein